MKKNKILGLAIAAIIAMSTIVPAFAADITPQDTTTNATTVQTQQISEAEKLVKLTEKSSKIWSRHYRSN